MKVVQPPPNDSIKMHSHKYPLMESHSARYKRHKNECVACGWTVHIKNELYWHEYGDLNAIAIQIVWIFFLFMGEIVFSQSAREIA